MGWKDMLLSFFGWKRTRDHRNSFLRNGITSESIPQACYVDILKIGLFFSQFQLLFLLQHSSILYLPCSYISGCGRDDCQTLHSASRSKGPPHALNVSLTALDQIRMAFDAHTPK